MTSSTIFINEPTVVDHSYITGSGRIVGGSVNPTFLVTGEVTEDENVVLDFSKAKKELKRWIDDNDNGFDHKCWIVQHVSQLISVVDLNTKENVGDWSYLASSSDPDRLLAVSTPMLQLRAPKSAFRFVMNQSGERDVNRAVATAMESWLKEHMPEFSIRVLMRENPIPVDHNEHTTHPFRYVHGLKHSSSWGCQNIAHGHLSFIAIDGQWGGSKTAIDSVTASIARQLNDTVFISAENYDRDEYFVNIGYESTSRGRFEMSINRAAQQKYVVLETETTIEHIIEYVAANFKTQLKSVGATRLYVSEGLSKGAVLELDYN